MRYLLDTNVFLFLISGKIKSLSTNQLKVLYDASNELFLSEASLFEIGIKSRIGKESFSYIEVNTIELNIKTNNIKLLKAKPAYFLNIPKVSKVYISENKLHGDPFDLLIISQAIIEDIPILSTDRLFPEYEGISVIS
jgi:PIN domain nuclease of toxin-antitoxin system